MKTLALLASFLPSAALVAASLQIEAANPLPVARESETLVVPWSEILKALPDAKPDSLIIRDSTGKSLPYQFTNYNPGDRRGLYDEVLFQHDFAAGENTARFTVTKASGPVPPFTSRVFCRYVPERLDDFAWENDRVAHRIYGQALNTEAAGKSRMISSGIDVWAKRVPYLTVDRWYLRGHDNYHVDNGEGLDFYSVNTGRGCGGTGIWDGKQLHLSGNWKTWKVLANGPLRAIFELSYEPWDAGNGVSVAETKRFTIDAGRNVDTVQSTFTFQGPESLVAAVGVGKHKPAKPEVAADASHRWLTLWETYPKEVEAQLGTGIVVPSANGSAEDELNYLLLAPIKSGVPLTYLEGAGWSRSGQFPDRQTWETYVAHMATLASAPVTLTYSVEK